MFRKHSELAGLLSYVYACLRFLTFHFTATLIVLYLEIDSIVAYLRHIIKLSELPCHKHISALLINLILYYMCYCDLTHFPRGYTQDSGVYDSTAMLFNWKGICLFVITSYGTLRMQTIVQKLYSWVTDSLLQQSFMCCYCSQQKLYH